MRSVGVRRMSDRFQHGKGTGSLAAPMPSSRQVPLASTANSMLRQRSDGLDLAGAHHGSQRGGQPPGHEGLLPSPVTAGVALRTGKALRTLEVSRSGNSGVATPHDGGRPDWRILCDTILASLDESPKAFLATVDQMKKEPQDFWEGKLRSATWTVVQRGDEILGIAAAKPPGELDSYAQSERACFIESVWISPALRKHGIGKRLVTYIFEQECKAGIRQFYLWVFSDNTSAINFYEQMKFRPTENQSELLGDAENQYLKEFGSSLFDRKKLALIAKLSLARNARRRKRDLRDSGIGYRVLNSHPG